MNPPAEATRYPFIRIGLNNERDIVAARQQLRDIADACGFDLQDQIRLATSVSEIARNAYQYAERGRVIIDAFIENTNSGLLVEVTDEGRGIPNLDDVLSGRYKSRTGMGMGLSGTQRLMDFFKISTSDKGTVVSFGKLLPERKPKLTTERIKAVQTLLANVAPVDPIYELQRQNQELICTLDELRNRQIELAHLNAELEATNRGVVALYAELDERATYLRRVSDLKTQFLSNMTHEFRTPLNSMRMLANMLLEHVDGPLNSEQDKQVGYILRAAEELSGFVDNLLDLAKVEAGKLTLRLSSFDLYSLFDVLKGMLKPLTNESPVSLIFEEVPGDVALYSDEGKVSQILRNFISNALKFTKDGEVRVSAQIDDESGVTFCVADTGIGIKSDHLDLIFEEFGQVDNEMQSNAAGTGLGLPLSRRLASLLGGKIWVESEPGKGSKFYLHVPPSKAMAEFSSDVGFPAVKGKQKVLIIDDDEVVRYVLQNGAEAHGCEVIQAGTGEEGLELAVKGISAIFLDLNMPGIDGFKVLERLKANESTHGIPVLICTSMELSQTQKSELSAGGAVKVISKGASFADNAMAALGQVLSSSTETAKDKGQ